MWLAGVRGGYRGCRGAHRRHSGWCDGGLGLGTAMKEGDGDCCGWEMEEKIGFGFCLGLV